MARSRNLYWLIPAAFLVIQVPVGAAPKKELRAREAGSVDVSALWRDPGDIRSRDLYYGMGGKEHEPQGPFTFVKEDLDGTNPKFVVKDGSGTKWKVKMGEEAKPETAASRFVWAIGYFTDEEYFVKDLKVEKMERLKRGQKQVSADGTVHNVRLKREPKDEKKLDQWEWKDDPFEGTREWNGLRVLMALVNNWDLKDENNAIRRIDGKPVYMISDLGASFGTTGWSYTRAASKGNLKHYEDSKFIVKVTQEYVDFQVPSRPNWIHLVGMRDFVHRVHLEWIGRRVPRSDVRWAGQMLAQLSDAQVMSAFRAAGYDEREVQGFSAVVEKRIAELGRL